MEPNNNNRVRRLILLAALAVCAAAFAALAIKTRMDERDRRLGIDTAALARSVAVNAVAAAPTPAPILTLEPEEPEPPSQSYIVRAHQGYLAVFLSDDPAPLEITDTRIAGLRRADQLLLREGIPVSGREALSKLLEDFSN